MSGMPAINAATRISTSERLARQEYARQLEQIELDIEHLEDVELDLKGMTIDEFKASDKYEPFSKKYKRQTKYLKSSNTT